MAWYECLYGGSGGGEPAFFDIGEGTGDSAAADYTISCNVGDYFLVAHANSNGALIVVTGGDVIHQYLRTYGSTRAIVSVVRATSTTVRITRNSSGAISIVKLLSWDGISNQNAFECGGYTQGYSCQCLRNAYSKMDITSPVTVLVYGTSSFYTGYFGGSYLPTGTLLYEGKNGSDIDISGYDYICFGKKTYSDSGAINAILY